MMILALGLLFQLGSIEGTVVRLGTGEALGRQISLAEGAVETIDIRLIPPR